jgi:SAM-dependent methyltransferase
MTNSYTPQWFDVFLRNVDPAQTDRELGFLRRYLPQPRYTTLVDLCCGFGRHARALATRGYSVIGIDRDRTALAEARRRSPQTIRYIEHDMQALGNLALDADAFLCLWQSFGYFDDATNAAIVGQISGQLRPQGRLVLDIYHRSFFEQNQGTRTFEYAGTQITETKTVRAGRMQVALRYAGTEIVDRFDWRLYTPEEICALAGAYQFHPVLQCTNYDDRQPPTPAAPRMQFVFEKIA